MELNEYHKQRNKKAIEAVRLQQENPISYEKKVEQMKRLMIQRISVKK